MGQWVFDRRPLCLDSRFRIRTPMQFSIWSPLLFFYSPPSSLFFPLCVLFYPSSLGCFTPSRNSHDYHPRFLTNSLADRSFSSQRHVTRQKILNWKQSLRFPSRPKVSHAGVDLMQQLLCEPEDRLGSQAASSASRPDSMILQSRRSGFVNMYTGTGSVDGAELIKVR